MAHLDWLKVFIILAVFSLTATLSEGFVASSSNYILQSDTINFGGNYSTSSSYKLQDTLMEVGTGMYASSTIILNSGYQAMPLDIYLAITSPSDLTMSPITNGVGVSDGSSSLQVQTDNPAGYELAVRADTSPALISSGDSFTDYVSSFSTPDYSWNTPDSESRFGFSAEGDDLVSSFLDNGVSCGVGSQDHSGACWVGFSTTNQVVARASLPNYPVGASTTIKFRAEVGFNKLQTEGDYQSNITVTVIAL